VISEEARHATTDDSSCLLIVGSLGTWARNLPAATTTLTATITNTFSPDGQTLQSPPDVIFDGQPHIYQVDVLAQLGGTISPTESFGSASFDILPTGQAVSRISFSNANVSSGWRPNDPPMTNVANSSGVLIPTIFSGGANGDLGTPNDFIGIAQVIDTATHSITLEHLDKFSHIGLLSGGVVSPADVENSPGFKDKVKVVFCSCGSRENPSNISANHEALDQLGVKNTAYVSPHTAHEFQTW
jgi:hypothetical protein